MKSETIKFLNPKPFEEVELQFRVSGKVPKSWLRSDFGIQWRISLDYLDARGSVFVGNSINIVPPSGLLQRFRNSVDFSVVLGFNENNLFFLKKSQGRIALKFSGQEWMGQVAYLPLVVRGFEPEGGVNEKILEMHRSIPERLAKREVEMKNYFGELSSLAEKRRKQYEEAILEDTSTGKFYEIQDRRLLQDMRDILEFSDDLEFEEIRRKYEEALEIDGPPIGGIVGELSGFLFRVYSHDPGHGPHFHVVHQGRGVNARFSFPEIQLLSYKGHSGRINSKEVKNIQHYFRDQENLKKLQEELHRTNGVH